MMGRKRQTITIVREVPASWTDAGLLALVQSCATSWGRAPADVQITSEPIEEPVTITVDRNDAATFYDTWQGLAGESETATSRIAEAFRAALEAE